MIRCADVTPFHEPPRLHIVSIRVFVWSVITVPTDRVRSARSVTVSTEPHAPLWTRTLSGRSIDYSPDAFGEFFDSLSPIRDFINF